MSTAQKSIINLLGRRNVLLTFALLTVIWASWKVSQQDDQPSNLAPARPVSLTLGKGSDSYESAQLSVPKMEWPDRGRSHQAIPDVFEPAHELASKGMPSGGISRAPPRAFDAADTSEKSQAAFDYKYMGQVSSTNGNNIFLTDGKDALIQATVGQDLGYGWALSAIAGSKLVFRNSQSGQEKVLEMRMN
jgi:hypothetical protein